MTDTNIEACANCGKGEEESANLKACTACYLVKYCNRDCQAAHRPEHKKACKKRAAELHEEALFTQPPQKEDCPICFLPLPLTNGTAYKTCCRKHLCRGCVHAHIKLAFQGRAELGKCEFCRQMDADTDEERLEQVQDLVNKNDPNAMEILARYHAMGEMGFQQDFVEANKWLLKAGKLGNPEAYYNLGNSYYRGLGVEINVKTARKYWELAAIGGNVSARANLGKTDGYQGNEERAYKHLIIAARAGDKECLDNVRNGCQRGVVTKDDYAEALKEYQKREEEMKSEMRDEAVRYQANRSLYQLL